MWQRLGRVMKSGSVVDLDFTVGTFRCEDCIPIFNFTQRLGKDTKKTKKIVKIIKLFENLKTSY